MNYGVEFSQNHSVSGLKHWCCKPEILFILRKMLLAARCRQFRCALGLDGLLRRTQGAEGPTDIQVEHGCALLDAT